MVYVTRKELIPDQGMSSCPGVICQCFHSSECSKVAEANPAFGQRCVCSGPTWWNLEHEYGGDSSCTSATSKRVKGVLSWF